MPIVNLEQGSSKWLEYRLSKIMATDASIINETNPFKTPFELWEEKLLLRPSQASNAAMQRGQDLEPIARQKANEILEKDFIPEVFESNENPWAAASLDGIYLDYILEIKCPKVETHANAITGHVPLYYMDQMQWQLLCTGAIKCYYFSYRPEYIKQPYAIVEVLPDLERQNRLLIKGRQFYTDMCTFSKPKPWRETED